MWEHSDVIRPGGRHRGGDSCNGGEEKGERRRGRIVKLELITERGTSGSGSNGAEITGGGERQGGRQDMRRAQDFRRGWITNHQMSQSR